VSALGIVVLVAGILLFIALLFALILIPVSRRAKRLRAELEAELWSETRIVCADVTAVETPKSWLGKSVGTRLLCVRWPGDAMAWEVRDLDAWLAALSSDPRA